MIGTIDPLCGVPAHRMGRWVDVVLGIWWCPDCGAEIWATEGVDGDAEAIGVRPPGAGPEDARGGNPGVVPALPAGVPDGGDAAGARPDRAPGDGVGWRDRDGGVRLWALILEAFGRAAS